MAFTKAYGLSGKMQAIRAFINTWIKEPTLYCNTCGTRYTGMRGKWVCDSKYCSNPQIGTNMDHTYGVMKQNKMVREEMLNNEFGSSASKSLRYAVSMPPQLLKDLEAYFRSQYDEDLFDDKHVLRRFMREFPQFCIARRI